MTGAIIVPQLSIHVATGEAADDPWGQGFSAISAEVVTSDPVLVDILSNAKRERRQVVLRCALLDVIGPITRVATEAGSARFILSVDDLLYRKPTRRLGVQYRK
jgi:hypothetical protein